MSENLYFARQPILDTKGKTYAYELLYRNSLNQSFPPINDDKAATAQVLVNSLNYVGLGNTLGKAYAFINIDESLLLDDMLLSIPKEKFVLEILETVIINDTIIDRIIELKDLGYRFALDDVDCSKEYIKNFQPIFKYMDILKLDIGLMDNEALPRYLKLFKQFNLMILAEKVETQEEFDTYKALGCDLFQGFFFAKPDIIENKTLDPEYILILNLIQKLQQHEDVDEICHIFEQNVAITLQLLRFINSAAFSFRASIKSIRQAVVLLGPSQLKSWLLLISYANASKEDSTLDNPLLHLAQTRSNMMQTITQAVYKEQCNGVYLDKAAFIGLLSLVDVLFQTPLEVIMEELNVDDDIAITLIDKKGLFGTIYKLICAVELFDTSGVDQYLKELSLSNIDFSKAIEDAYIITEEFSSSLHESI